MSKIPAINEIDVNSPSQESTEVVVKATTVTPDINEIQETISASATIQEIDGIRKPTISEIYKIVNDGLFESTTNWWDYAYKVSQAQLNQDIISRLDNGVIGGGYSKGVDIITTTSNKVPTNTNVYSALKSDSLYPKKLNDEVINGIYDFLNGLTIGKPTAYTGGTWSVDQTGRTHLTTDYLYVRLKAIFETLQILNVDTIGGKLVISPAGSIRVAYVDRIKIDAPVFTHNEETDVWSISQVEDAEGNLVNETLNQEVYRCYFLGEQDGEEIENKWKVGDQAQAKTFNVKKGTYHKVENSYLWRLVVNVSSDTVDIDGKKYHYVDLSQIDFDSGSDAPAPGDILNQLGHRLNDTQRQTALVLNAVDNYAPSITLYAGVNYYTLLNKEYVEFGVYNGKAFFNVYGDMYIGDKGENPKTYIKYKNGKINIKANLEIGSSIGDKDLDQYIKENGGVDEETVKNLINNAQVIKDLQNQADGAIETWFYEGVPTLDNLPAIDWTTEDLKKIHIGDLYYDQTTGYAYRFTKYNDDVNPYRWNRIKDNDIVAALETANRAQATADGKMKVFYGNTKPTNYQVGDIWVNATLEGKFNNDIARAVATSEVFNADDWVLASRYSEAIATIQKWTNEYETKFGNLADEVKKQKDQSIVVWYYGYEPTVDNVPANSWNTDDLRSEHIGDIFYDIKNNHSYRWTGSAWVQIKDADFDKAMEAAKDADNKAGAAGDLADSKRRIFYSATTPTKPFDKGDLWIKQVGDKTETWVYNGTNWVKSDDKDLADFSTAINEELTGIKGQLDGKAETWYQNTNPRNKETGVWESGGTDKSHEGDIWYNTDDGTTNYWNGSAWEQMDIPKDVFNTIDGKSSIFVDSYADAKAGTGVINKGYKERDLWILPEDATVNGVKYYKGDMLTAISNNTNFDETNWKKKVRYVGPTELNKAIDVVNEKINTINNITIPGINNKFNEFIEDGVLDSSEKARLTDLLNQASNEVAAVIDQVNNITTSKYLTNDNANKGKLEEANTVMKTAWTEYKNLINTLIAANTEITKVNIGEANTKYRNLQEKIKTVKQYLAICQADILSGMGTDITSYKYLKDALNQTTEINGGLVLTSAIQLKDVDKKVTAGMNGIVKGDKTSIAAWYGGPMVDRDTFTSEELETKVPGTDYAMSLLRHDGTGYLAGGNIHWNADGVLSGNFNSFILQGTSIATMFYYIRLFYLHTANPDNTDFNNIDYVTPMKTFSRLSVLPLGGIEGGNNLPTGLFIGDSKTGGSFQIGNIILRTKSGDPNILEIVSADSKKTAHLGVQGGVSAYGTYTPSTGGGGGLNGTIVPYSTAITSDPQNEGTKIASASSIYKLHSRISSIENNGATSITVTGTGNAITSVVKNGTSITFTKGATFLTSHQSLANYYTKSSVDSLLSGKSATSHTHSVKINGVTKTIAATGGTVVDLGTYLTSHQSLNGYATQSWVKSQGYLTSHQDVSVLTMANDRYYTNNAYGINMRNSDIIGVNSIYTNDVSETPNEAILFFRSNGNYDGIRAVNGVLYFSNNVVRTTSKYDAEYEVYHKGNLTKLSQLTNDKNFVTGSVSGQTITINGVSTTWQNTWRGITDSYSGTSTGTSLSQKGANSLYNALHNGYASSAGNADTVDGYHESSFLRYRGEYGDASVTKDGVGVYGWAHTNEGHNNFHESYGDIINIQGYSSWRTRFDIGISGRIRIMHGINTTTATQVGYLAYLHDNVASATKLQTPRTIWGQSFNGTANVSGNMIGVGNINTSAAPAGTIYTNDWFRSKGNTGWYSEDHGGGWYMSDNTWIRNFGGKDVCLSNKLCVNSNVGIGTTAPSHKLHVLGEIYTTTKVNINGIILEKDSNGNLKVNGNLYATGGISAYGTSSAGSGGGLSGSVKSYADALKLASESLSEIASAYSIKQLSTRITSLEGGSATSISVSGGGNAVTSVTKNGTTISVVKGSTFSLSGHTHKWADITDRPSSLKNPSALSWSGYSSGSYDGSAAKSISIPNNTNQLTNGAGFITASASITGNAATATKVNHSLSVFGKSFNGSADVTVADTDLIASILTATANLTDKTEILTSYASDNGFNDSNAKNRILRRPASAIWGYINSKTISNADKLDNVHLNGIFTALSNTNNGVSMTIGTVAKSLANMQVYSATKLVTARNIALNGDFTGNANFDGSANITINGYMSYCNATVSNTNTYRWRRIAKVNEITGNYSDGCILLYISEGFDGGCYGIARVYIRTDNLSTGANASCSIQWISRNGYGLDSLKIAMYKTTGKAYYDVFLKMRGAYTSVVIRTLQDQRGGLDKRFTLVNSTETTNAASHTEAYATIEDAATAIHNQAYTSIAQGSDVATVHNADMVDGIHASGLFTNLSNSGNSLSITVGGTNKTLTVNYASNAGNADTLDGVHASGLFTNLSNSGNNISITIGGTNKTLTAAYATNCDTVDGYHAQLGSSKPYGKIPVIGTDGVIELGHYIDFHHDNTTGSDYSVRLQTNGNHSNVVTLPTATGTLALTSGNVASATKLQTPRTIWGQSFDGTGNVNGTIYINNSDSKNGAIILNNNVNANARISAIKNQVVFNTGAAIRFGAVDWNYSDWAGLKYDTVANAIYLGIADGTVFNYYPNKRSNGTLKFPCITTITPDGGARIGGSGGDLYLGNANNSGFVKVQDMCSQVNSSYWNITQHGSATFKSLTVINGISCNDITVSKNAVITGDLSVNGLIYNKGILPTNYEVNNKGAGCYVSADALCSGITAITDSIPVDNLSIVYSNDNGTNWTNYNISNDAKFKAYANVAGVDSLYLGGNVITGNTNAEKLAQIKKNELMFSFEIPNSCYSQVYFACVDMAQGVGVTCTVEYLNSKGVIVNTYIKYMAGWNQFNYINLSNGNTAVGVGNDDRRYIRFRFKHDQNTTALRNASINKIRIFAFTKYSFPTGRSMGHTGHIYNFDYNMNTYFPNSILAKGGVTAYQSSDIRLKTNITKLNCLNVIKSIGGTYEFDYIRDNKHSIGFIAQNVNNPLLKDIVAKDDNGYLKINYWNPKLISLAFGALTEIDDEVDKLKARVRELENEVEYLKNKDYALQ